MVCPHQVPNNVGIRQRGSGVPTACQRWFYSIVKRRGNRFSILRVIHVICAAVLRAAEHRQLDDAEENGDLAGQAEAAEPHQQTQQEVRQEASRDDDERADAERRENLHRRRIADEERRHHRTSTAKPGFLPSTSTTSPISATHSSDRFEAAFRPTEAQNAVD